MLVVSGLGFGCGSDSKKDTGTNNNPATGDGDKGGNGDGDIASGDGDTGDGDKTPGGDGDHTAIPDAGSTGGKPVGNMYPQCTPAVPVTFMGYNGEKKFTKEADMACSTKCGMDQTCYTDANCPGLETFQSCVVQNGASCEAPKGTACRDKFVDLLCCLNTECLAADKKSIDPNCTKCDALNKSYIDCFTADTKCFNDTALDACYATGASSGDAGTPDSDAGTKPPTPIGGVHSLGQSLRVQF